jgi:hypothetical protein
VPRRTGRIAVAAVLTAGLLTVPAARADTQVAASGQVRATFSFAQGDYGQDTDFHLTVDRAGQRLFDAPLSVCCQPQETNGKAVHVRDLDGDDEPEVWVDIWAGGAHCCTQMELLRLSGGAYQRQEHVFELGYRLKDLDGDGIPEFKTVDYGFAYAFTFFAASPLPVRVLSYRAGVFSNVTAKYPALVRKDLKRYRSLYRKGIRHHVPSLGALAGWTADDYVLGHRKQANRRLTRELHAGHLYNDTGYVHGRKFIRVLKHDLRLGDYGP